MSKRDGDMIARGYTSNVISTFFSTAMPSRASNESLWPNASRALGARNSARCANIQRILFDVLVLNLTVAAANLGDGLFMSAVAMTSDGVRSSGGRSWVYVPIEPAEPPVINKDFLFGYDALGRPELPADGERISWRSKIDQMNHANLAHAIGAEMIHTEPCVRIKTARDRPPPSEYPGGGPRDRNPEGVHNGTANQGSARGRHEPGAPHPRRSKREAPAMTGSRRRARMAGYG